MHVDMRPVFFVHVSASGGSSLCRWAEDQPCGRVPACGSNCNLNCRHPWDWKTACEAPACKAPSTPCRPPFRPGCEGLARYARRRNMTFLASETLLLERCFDTFQYVIIIRDPIERLQSIVLRMTSPNLRIREVLERPYAFNTTTRTSFMGTAAVDNYLTRLLLGPSAFFLPLRGINASHYQVASRVLASFSFAIPIERFEPEGVALLRAQLGWQGLPKRSNSHRTAASRRSDAGGRRRLSAAVPTQGHGLAHSARGFLAERTVRVLRALNEYDLRLLEQARERFGAQWRAHQAREQADIASGASTRTTTSSQGGSCPRERLLQCPPTAKGEPKPTWHLGNVH